ncbi:MAG: hypothetical protein ACLU4S_02580 [Clostridium perfringens]
MKIDISKIYGLYEVPEYGTVCKRGKTIKDLEKKILDKNEEIKYLNEVIDALEEEKEELDNECYELEEENVSLKEELEKVKKGEIDRSRLLIKRMVDKIIEKDKLIEELRKENREFKMEKIAKEMKTCINPEIIKAGLTSMKNCLDAIDLLSDKGDEEND